jgi:acetone carboxylase gamma subunit
VNEYLEVVEEGGKKVIRCRCGYIIGPAADNYKNNVLRNEAPLSKAGPFVNPYKIGGEKFVFRQFCCPGCFTLLDTEIALKGAPLLWDVQPKL